MEIKEKLAKFFNKKTMFSKVNIFLYLLIIYTLGAFYFNRNDFGLLFVNLVSLLVLTGIGYGIFYLLKLKMPKFSTFLISILIIFLLLFPEEYTLSVFIIHILLVVGLFLVKFIRVHNKPIINPAVFAFIFASIVVLLVPVADFVFISWWGGAYGGYIGLALLLPLVIYAGIAFKKWPLLLAFFITQTIIFALFENIEFTIFTYTIFLAGVMLLEIKTSPIKFHEQIVFGIVGALLVSYTPSLLDIDSQVLAIGIANLLFFTYREIKLFSPKKNINKK